MICCPHCKYPLAAPVIKNLNLNLGLEDGGTGADNAAESGPDADIGPGLGIIIPCGTCKAIICVITTTIVPPSAAWVENEFRRTNRSGPAYTVCADCREPVAVTELAAGKHVCSYRRRRMDKSKPAPVLEGK